MAPSHPPCSSPSRSLRVGLAGLGQFGRQHAAVLSNLPDVELAGLCDSNAKALQAQLNQHPQARGYANLEDLARDPNLDAIVIATPEELHVSHGLIALESGRAVFLEKPMAATGGEAEHLRQTARAKGVHLQIGLLLRYEASHARLKQDIASGGFGELVSIRVKRNCSRPWADNHLNRGPTVLETLIHDLDLMLWLTGSPATTVTYWT